MKLFETSRICDSCKVWVAARTKTYTSHLPTCEFWRTVLRNFYFTGCKFLNVLVLRYYSLVTSCIIIIIIIIIIVVGIQPLGRSGQRPEFSQVTGIALVRCILGKVWGVACHCFPPLFRCSHFSPPGASTSAMTWEISAAEMGTVGEKVVR